jgi:hypothetical protein
MTLTGGWAGRCVGRSVGTDLCLVWSEEARSATTKRFLLFLLGSASLWGAQHQTRRRQHGLDQAHVCAFMGCGACTHGPKSRSKVLLSDSGGMPPDLQAHIATHTRGR